MNPQTSHHTTDKSEIYTMVSFGHKEQEGEKNTNVFVFAYSGMVDAATVLDPNIKVEWHGPNAWDPIPEIKAIEDLTARQVDGIMVTAADKTALDKSINAAIAADIPVINFDADSPKSDRLTLVSTDNYKAGYLAGQTMAEWLGGKGDVAVSTIEQADHLIERLQGFEDAMREFAPESKIHIAYDSGSIEVDETGRQDFSEYRQSYVKMLQAHPETRGLFTTYSIPGAGAAEAVEELGLQGKIQVLAFDFDEVIIKLVGTDKIRATVGQDPYMMGYVSMILLYAARHATQMPNKNDGTWRVPALVDFLDTHPKIQQNTAAKLQRIIDLLKEGKKEISALIDTGATVLGKEELLDILARDFEDMRDSISDKIETLGREVEVRKQAERELRHFNEELEQRVEERTAEIARQSYILDTFIENLPDLIYFKDLDSRITRTNQAHATSLGLNDPAEEIGKSDFDFLPEEQAKIKQEQEQEIIRTGRPISLEEPHDQGWVLTTKMPLRDENGDVIGTFGISRDITPLKQAQAELEQAYAEMEQQVRERTAELQQEVAERERLQAEVIETQQRTLQELSTPVIPIMDRIIVMPLVGSIDSMRAREITRALLAGIGQHRAKMIILDVTGVGIMDTGIVNNLNRTIQAARLKGAQTIVTGVSDAVAEAIVDLGIDWSDITTLSDLQTGLVVALHSLGIKLTQT